MKNPFLLLKRPCQAVLIAVTISFSIPKASAQPLLSANFQNAPLTEAFKTLEASGGITVSYDPDLVKNLRVTATFSDKKPAEAFAILLRETPLTAEVVRERHVLILRRPEPPPTLTLCARLVDADTREALPYASIFSQNTQSGAQSNADGRFTLTTDAAQAQTDTLLVRMIGYRPLRLPAVRLLGKNCPDIWLRPASRELMQITVTDRALEPLHLSDEGPAAEVHTGRGGLVPSLGEPDPFRMIQFLPGVAADGDKADELLVRGGSTDQNLVLWEGIPIYHTGHLFGLVSALNPYVVDRVNVWKGNFSADYGGRVSSLIDMHTETGPLEHTQLSVGVNLVSTYFSLETPLFRHKGGLLLAGRHAFSGVLQSSTYQKLFGFATQNSRIQSDQDMQQSDSLLRQTYRITPASAFSDGNLKAWWQPNARTHIDLNMYGGFDVLRYRREVDLRRFGFYFAGGDTVRVGNVGLSMRVHRAWTDNYSSEWRLAASNYQSTYDFSGTFDPDDLAQYTQKQDNTLREGVLQFDNRWRLSRRQQLQFGFQAVKTGNVFQQKFTNESTPGSPQEIEVDLPSNQSSFYGIWRLGDSIRWYLEAGLRHTTFNYSTRSYWEPRLSAHWQTGPHFRLKASAGVFHQFMRRAYVFNDLGLNNEVWFTTDENLKLPVLRSTQVSAGFSFDKKGWLLDVEFYGKVLDPVTGVNFRFNGTPQPMWNARGVENAGGLEILLRKRWGAYTHWLSYTSSQAGMTFDSINGGQSFPADFDQRQAISWAHHVALKRWSFALTWSYHSGRPFTPATGAGPGQQPDGSQAAVVAYGPRNSGRLPDYSRVDTSVQYHFGEEHITGTVGLSVFNMFNHANVQSREFFAETYRDASGQPVDYGVGSVERALLGRMVNLFVLLRW